MWTFRTDTFFSIADFGSREKCTWQEPSKYMQEMHGAARKVLAVLHASWGNE